MPEGLIPAYDLQKASFSNCDKFNRELHGRTWPFKHGGFKRLGDEGAEDDFAFTTLLLNAFNAYRDIGDKKDEYQNFTSFCNEVADSLYDYALGLR